MEQDTNPETVGGVTESELTQPSKDIREVGKKFQQNLNSGYSKIWGDSNSNRKIWGDSSPLDFSTKQNNFNQKCKGFFCNSGAGNSFSPPKLSQSPAPKFSNPVANWNSFQDKSNFFFGNRPLARIKEQRGLSPMGDFDRDKVINSLDCYPRDPRRQGAEQSFEQNLEYQANDYQQTGQLGQPALAPMQPNQPSNNWGFLGNIARGVQKEWSQGVRQPQQTRAKEYNKIYQQEYNKQRKKAIKANVKGQLRKPIPINQNTKIQNLLGIGGGSNIMNFKATGQGALMMLGNQPQKYKKEDKARFLM